ncbi:olfactory receptor 5D13-like isoform X1 [Dromiciops gliroides]|uniref:olfactory receptor 5D13-like isoform X1 n=1 Tax=Dromiciops gliroides TaxID=33562 RepID=UPI001CC4BF30|nr:olfactory receptor 5D13-like isoform X1 [Dromiciops gliroides]
MPSNDKNQSTAIVFILLGFSEYPELQVPLFLLFLTIYVVSVLENVGMIVIIKINPKLHTPMYFFLKHLSFVDFCYSTIVMPILLENLVVEDRSIAIKACITQFSFGIICVTTEMVMLAVMAYDRFVAICYPLLYTGSMSPKLCALLVTMAYSWGLISSIVLTYSLLVLSFCESKVINNFVCEYSVFLSASCSDKHFSEIMLFIFANLSVFCTLIIILTSYLLIFITILKMHSARGRYKAFSTCASHLTAVTIFYGTILFLYCIPNSKNSWLVVKVGSVFYIVVIPMLNPLIYSLRNKDVKETFRKFMDFKMISQ